MGSRRGTTKSYIDEADVHWTNSAENIVKSLVFDDSRWIDVVVEKSTFFFAPSTFQRGRNQQLC